MEKRKKSIAVIVGQGGGIGSIMIKRLREVLGEEVEVAGLGTNAMATGAMLKGGANKGASGENAIVQSVKTVDIVIGTVGIVIANSMMGELTPNMAEAIGSPTTIKCLLPSFENARCRNHRSAQRNPFLTWLINLSNGFKRWSVSKRGNDV